MVKFRQTTEERLVFEAMIQGLRPRTRQGILEWASENYMLSPESSAVETPTRFRPHPFQVAWLEAAENPEIERISVMKPVRVGYTTFLKVVTAYYMKEWPKNIMIVQPTIQDAEDFSKEEIAPMIRDVRGLQKLIAASRAKDSDSKILFKKVPNGYLVLVGANSPRGFRRRSIGILEFDEIDGYAPSAGDEGDQLQLGENRTLDHPDRKIIYGSTPTLKGISRIEEKFLESNQQRLHVPCPDCGFPQALFWGGFKWDKGDPESVIYLCANCGSCIPPRKKRLMVENGDWIAAKPEIIKHAGFHIWQAYSYNPLTEWPLLVERWEANHKTETGLRAFINTVLAETYELKTGDMVGYESLYARREAYDPQEELPVGVLVITMATDVQDNRIETEIAGWGVGEEKWVLDYVVTMGDPAQKEVWDAHDELLETKWNHPLGFEMGVTSAVIDSGGHHTDSVYSYVKPRQGRKVYAIKGSSLAGHPIIDRSKGKNKGGVALYFIGTDAVKDLISARLKIEDSRPGAMHHPDHLLEEYFRQMTTEYPIPTYRRGVPVRVWTVVPKGARNEAFDCAGYNLANLRLLNVSWGRLEKRIHAMAVEAEDAEPSVGAHDETASKKRKPKKPKFKKPKYNAKKW